MENKKVIVLIMMAVFFLINLVSFVSAQKDVYFVYTQKGDFDKTLNKIITELTGGPHPLTDVNFKTTRFKLFIDERLLSWINRGNKPAYEESDMSYGYDINNFANVISINRATYEASSVPDTVFGPSMIDTNTLKTNENILDLSLTSGNVYIFKDEQRERWAVSTIHSSKSEGFAAITSAPTFAGYPWSPDGYYNTYGNGAYVYIDSNGELHFKYKTQAQQSRIVFSVGILACDCSSGECCDGCNFRPNTYGCRSAAGECDIAEYCTAASADCPMDVFEAFGTTCSSGACDGAGDCGECDSNSGLCGSVACKNSFFLGDICCGDDDNEYYNSRMGNIIDIGDGACCSFNTDCVYNRLCYNEGKIYELDGEAYDCNNGEWGIVLKQKCDWNNENCDYCDSDLKCLTPQKQCINSGEFIDEHYCENGEWTSRTKLISLQLLDISNQKSTDNYTLFCDSYKNTLNYYQYLIGGVPVTQHLSEVNNFCILKLPEQVIFGASLNVPINVGGFIDALTGVSDCDNAIDIDDGKFHQCNGGSSKAWYNDKIQSLIYSDKDILNNPPEFEINAWEAFLTFLKNPFQETFDFLFGLIEQKPELGLYDYKFIENTKDFSRIYLDKKNIRSIRGVTEKVEPIGGEYLSVTYGMYRDDICSTVNTTYERFKPSQKDIVLCYYDARTRAYYVVSNHSAALALWPDLTAKLRTRAPPEEEMQYCYARKESCGDGENAILFLSDLIDAHATKVGIGGFEYRLCCKDYELDASCSQEEIVRLSSEEDAHASAPDISLFDNPICVMAKDSSKIVSCESVLYPGGCYPEEVCVVSLSDIADAHLSSCEDTQFGVRICCKVEEPVCGDGKIQNGEECDSGVLNGGDFCSQECKFVGEKNVLVVCQLMSGVATNDHLCGVWFGSFSGSCVLGTGQNQCTTDLLLPINGNENHYKPHLKGTLEEGQMTVNAYNGVNYFVNFELIEPSICTDSDGGMDYYTFGGVYGVFGSDYHTAQDACCMHCLTAPSEGGIWLSEYYCTPEARGDRDIKRCEYGCEDGVCLSEQKDEIVYHRDLASCEIIGNQINYETSTGSGGSTPINGCIGFDTSIEYYCRGDDLTFSFNNCPNGCQNGACIQ